MPETSRDVVVVLLDETTFTVPVKPTLLASELLDMAASHCKIKEKEYFGLRTEGDGYKNWLELDKPVLDPSQDLPKGSGQIKIFFTFKYFVDEVRYLQDYMTVELLYQFSRQAIMKVVY
ncbi:FERM domain-containing protein 4A [Geodia barretti]|uniref:FERM domain-containing protein 4A n=1 Tax=Geodia barretti TaxID=519541 RepID=A0AA35TU06_GEOBA|nr:FERM domain-containing protein 4A [Geodia barretti]